MGIVFGPVDSLSGSYWVYHDGHIAPKAHLQDIGATPDELIIAPAERDSRRAPHRGSSTQIYHANHRRAWRGGRWLVRGGGWLVRVGVSGRLMGIDCPGEFWSREDTNTTLFGRPLEGVQEAPCRSEKMRLAEAPRPFSGWSQIRQATMSCTE